MLDHRAQTRSRKAALLKLIFLQIHLKVEVPQYLEEAEVLTFRETLSKPD